LVVGLYDDSFSGDSAGYEGTSAMTFTLDPIDPIVGTSGMKLIASSDIGLNPSWMAASHQCAATCGLFALSESQLYSGKAEGSVASMELQCDGSLQVTSRQGSGGGAPAFLSIDPTGQYLLAANYAGGNVGVLPVMEYKGVGVLGPVQQVKEFGNQAKAHSAVFGPSAEALFVPTLGLDRVQQLTFSNGKISQNGDPLKVPENEGPRHIAFQPSGNVAVLLNEGSADAECTVVLCEFDESTGRITELATYDTLPATIASSSNMYPAEVQFTKDGAYVLVSMRDASDEKKDGITVFRVNEGALEFVEYAPVGHYPRSMMLTDDGLVITGNQKDNSLTVLHFDGGHLTRIGEDIPIGQSPAFVGVFDMPSCSSAVLV